MVIEVRENWITEVQDAAERIRLRVLERTIRNDGGYLSQACSSAELFATLYMKVMDLHSEVNAEAL